MSTDQQTDQITVEHEGRIVARADVRADPDGHAVRASMHVESGQLPPGTRAGLVDAVLDSAEVQKASHLQAAVPAGDAELLDRVRERCTDVQARRAGATTLVEGDVPRP